MIGTALEDGNRLMVVSTKDGLRRSAYNGDLGAWLVAGAPPEGLVATDVPVRDADLAPPIRPGKVIAVGLNYHDHVREAGLQAPHEPLVFAKFPSSVVGPFDDVRLPDIDDARVDWEVELGVVIATRMSRTPREETLSHVLGYTVVNDVSARAVQFSDGQWIRGKSFDTFCPVGPMVATPAEVGDPQDLQLRCWVNGELKQDSNTAQMIFGVDEILAYCSRWFTLEPGDLVITGTPWGCGEFADPPTSLRPGDVLRTEVAGIGCLENRVVGPFDAPDAPGTPATVAMGA